VLTAIIVICGLAVVWRVICVSEPELPAVPVESSAMAMPVGESVQDRQPRRHEHRSRPRQTNTPPPGRIDAKGTLEANVPEGQTLHIAGLVLTQEKKPVAGATIAYLEGADEACAFWSGSSHQERGRYAVSGADGRFELGPFVVTGKEVTRTLYARAPGFALAVREGVPPRAEKLVITLYRGQAVHGIVVNSAGNTVGGATVTWRSWPGPHGFPSGTCVTGEDGKFSMTGVPIFSTVEVTASGFSPTLLKLSGENGKSTSLLIRIEKGRTLHGTVVRAESANPIGGATVELWIVENDGMDGYGRRPYGTRMFERSMTDENGTFRFLDAPVDRPPANGHNIPLGRSIYLWTRSKGHAPTLLEVKNEEKKVIGLSQSGCISGRVVREDWSCVAGERVVASPKSIQGAWPESVLSKRRSRLGYGLEARRDPGVPWLSIWEATTDETGEFVIKEVPEGPVDVIVRSHTRPWASTSVIVSPGEVIRSIPTLVTPDAAPVSLCGKVVTVEGKPIVGATITITGCERQYTDGEGRFSVPYPVPDRYYRCAKPRIYIDYPGFPSVVEEVERDWIAAERQFVLERTVTVEGEVTDMGGHPVARAFVHLKAGVGEIEASRGGVNRGQPRLLVAKTSEEGSFREERLGPGLVQVLAAYPDAVRGPFFGRGNHAVAGGGQRLAVRIEELDVANFGFSRMTIRLLDIASRQVVKVPVSVELEKNGIVWDRGKAEAGAVTMKGVPGPSTYVLRVSAAGFATVSDVLRTPGNGQAGEHCVYLGMGGAIMGRVNTEGRLLRGSATLFGDDGASEAQVDESGRFVFRGVRESLYRVVVIARSENQDTPWVTACRRFEVSGDGKMRVELEAAPASVLWVGLLDPSAAEEDMVKERLPLIGERPRGRPFTKCEGGLRIEVRDQRGEAWYDAPPNVFGVGRNSTLGFEAVHARVAVGSYSVVIMRGGEVIASGNAQTGRVCFLRLPRTE